MSKKLRWGILSTANIGRKSVIPGLQYSQFNEVTAIASRDQAKAEEAAKELNIKHAYGSYEDLACLRQHRCCLYPIAEPSAYGMDDQSGRSG